MDRMMKSILVHMNGQENPESHMYNFHDDLEKIASKIEARPAEVRSCLRYLEKYEYIVFVRDQYGKAQRFSLDHKGLHWEEYRREEALRYFGDHWIDFLAMIVAIISLIRTL